MRFVVSTLMAALIALPGMGVAQEQAAPMQDERFRPPPGAGNLEAILHRDTFFSGAAFPVQGAQPNLNLPWDPRSIRVRSGEWQICTGRNYTGRCTTVDRDMPTLTGQFRNIQSMRPTGGWNTGVGQSLRGSSAEFFPAPLRNGQRIECTGGGNSSCARQAANNFCRSVGWLVSRSQGTEAMGGRSFVSDVLCARTAF